MGIWPRLIVSEGNSTCMNLTQRIRILMILGFRTWGMRRSKRDIEEVDQQEIENCNPKGTQACNNSSIITPIQKIIQVSHHVARVKKAKLPDNSQITKHKPSLKECRQTNNGRTHRHKEMQICRQSIKRSPRVWKLIKHMSGKIFVENKIWIPKGRDIWSIRRFKKWKSWLNKKNSNKRL